jgi:16S rRNA C967 or C1407 C5-methylase (RsmB/RsmF family)/NOL1/NOP2/fmu family ribosome biogenesis protein
LVPEKLIQSLHQVPGFDEAVFRQVHVEKNPPVSIRANQQKIAGLEHTLFAGENIPWCNSGYYLPSRPVFTLDPLLHAGAYYVQEASSMFLEQAVRYILQQIPVSLALDLCAAPGGKSTHLASLLPEGSVLVSNEVIATRTPILLENLVKWGNANVMVTQNDPADFGKLGPQFDLIVVDAPCSGSGLFRRDPEAIKEWSEQAVSLCAQRQQRILADALPAMVPGGFLVYATCSYSPAEDEEILDWLLSQWELESISLPDSFTGKGVVTVQSPEMQCTGYRFFPCRVKGEGFFMAVLQKKGTWEPKKPLVKPAKAVSLPKGAVPWVKQDLPLLCYRHKDTFFGMPSLVLGYFIQWQAALHIRKAGVRLGEELHGKFNPDHDFALSKVIQKEAVPKVEVSEALALQFLRRQDIRDWGLKETGWLLVTYHGLPLGWIKNLGNRFNNYYPTGWRIRMQ